MFVLRLIWKDSLHPAELLCTGEVWKIWWRLDFSDIFYPHTLLAFHLPSAMAHLGGTFIPHIPSPEDPGCTCTQLQELHMGVGKGKLLGVGGWTEMFLKGNLLFSFFLCILQNICTFQWTYKPKRPGQVLGRDVPAPCQATCLPSAAWPWGPSLALAAPFLQPHLLPREWHGQNGSPASQTWSDRFPKWGVLSSLSSRALLLHKYYLFLTIFLVAPFLVPAEIRKYSSRWKHIKPVTI